MLFVSGTADALIVGLCVFTGIAPLAILPVFLALLECNLRYSKSAVNDAGVRCHGCGYRVPRHPSVENCPECGRPGSADELVEGWSPEQRQRSTVSSS
ncbi:MAG: hypothetical protein AAF108_00800 [Planctomycetota bacterium]